VARTPQPCREPQCDRSRLSGPGRPSGR
jgi:hypothetical protein